MWDFILSFDTTIATCEIHPQKEIMCPVGQLAYFHLLCCQTEVICELRPFA
jgi:hypothetical protein